MLIRNGSKDITTDFTDGGQQVKLGGSGSALTQPEPATQRTGSEEARNGWDETFPSVTTRNKIYANSEDQLSTKRPSNFREITDKPIA